MNQGKCELCGKVFGRAAITRHLKNCIPMAEVGRNAERETVDDDDEGEMRGAMEIISGFPHRRSPKRRKKH